MNQQPTFRGQYLLLSPWEVLGNQTMPGLPTPNLNHIILVIICIMQVAALKYTNHPNYCVLLFEVM